MSDEEPRISIMDRKPARLVIKKLPNGALLPFIGDQILEGVLEIGIHANASGTHISMTMNPSHVDYDVFNPVDKSQLN